MNINEAKEIVALLNEPNYYDTKENCDLAIEAVCLAIKTAIDTNEDIIVGGVLENQFDGLDFAFKNIELEIGTIQREGIIQMACVIRSTIFEIEEDDFVDLNFDAIVAGIIRIDEIHIEDKNRRNEHKKEKNDLKLKLQPFQDKIPRLNNGLENKIVIKVNKLNQIDLNLTNLDEEKLKQIMEKLEEIQA